MLQVKISGVVQDSLRASNGWSLVGGNASRREGERERC